ncbi:MAG: adenylosuccinate lyase [archaeon]
MTNLNVLSKRYATPEINYIFSDEGTILAQRELWIAVMKAQKELGLDIPSKDIEKFEVAKKDIDLERIRKIEEITRHDVKAGIQDFINVSGAGEYIHLGMTSRDSTDNVEQMQNRNALEIILGKNISALRHLIDKSMEYKKVVIAARTHHQAAQPTLLGKRFSMWAEELMLHLKPLENFANDYPLRGIKGPVGTQSDMLELLGSRKKVEELEKIVAKHLGFEKVLSSTGQIYPRSLDLSLASHLVNLSSTYENFAIAMRLMAGYEQITEGFKEGQVGSSAMPHKMNTRSSERIKGFGTLLKGYQDMLSRISGEQWEEGDVSCSVVRRVAIPDMFYAADGQLETVLTVLNEMGVYEGTIKKELNEYLPLLATTQILMTAIQNEIGREKAHQIIKKHALAEVLKKRKTGEAMNILKRISEDTVFSERGITYESLREIVSNLGNLLGNAPHQIQQVSEKAEYWIKRYPQKAEYEPQKIL